MKIIFFQRRDVSFNGFLDILQRFCAAFTLTDTARKTGTFYYPVVIFTVVNNDLSHNDLPATPHNTSKIWLSLWISQLTSTQPRRLALFFFPKGL